MSLEYWLYPGARMEVSALTKITMVPAAPGEVPPAGAMIIPPQSPVTAAMQSIRAAQEANVAVAKQAMEATQTLTDQAAAEVRKVEEQTLTRAVQPPPWSVTFTEAR